MSLESGTAALNMQMTDRVPRVEYSAESHWPLVEAVTGIDTSIIDNRDRAQEAFRRKWDYAFNWSTDIGGTFLEETGGRTSRMGHAVYAELKDGTSDFNRDISQAFTDPEEVYELDFVREYGEYNRIGLVEKFEASYRSKCRRSPDTVNMGGVYVTLISGFIAILGWDMFLLVMGLDPKRFSSLMERYGEWIGQFYSAYAESSVPVIMCHDDICWSSGPFAHPNWYRQTYFPLLARLIEPLKQKGKKVMFTSDGDYTVFFGDIVRAGIDVVVMEPLSDMAVFADRYGASHGFVGNADTRILLGGTKADICGEVRRCMDIGRRYPGFIMAVGNHIPQNTPVRNALIYDEAYWNLSSR
jgi:hypothetical protein